MTNNMDEFEQDQFDADSGAENGNGKTNGGSVFENLKSKPVFKLAVIVGVVGVAVAGALGAFSSKPEVGNAQISAPPDVKGTPGGSVSPFYMEQNKIANEQRVDEALKEKGSALPTPVGQNSDLLNMDDLNKKDPLVEFRAETERLKQELRAEQQQNSVKLQLMQQQMQQQAAVAPRQQDDSLAQSMQRQMQQLMESWTPRNIKVVAGAEPAQTTATEGLSSNQSMPGQAASAVPVKAEAEAKAVIPSGTVNYAQLLTEANSDIPGPVMVQLLSGPLSGGRAIGTFKTMYEHLVLTFSVISYKGKDYPINAIALNPDTTLSGMATEVDHRYFMRLVLPAAASFMSAFGSSMGSANTTTTVNGDSVIVDQAKKGYDEALYDGLGQVGESIAGFLQQEAAQTKSLIRVAAGTPMGLFFLQPVMDKPGVGGQLYPGGMSAQNMLMQGYQQQIMPAYQQQMSAYPQAYTQTAPTGYNYPQATTASPGVDLSTITNNRSGTGGVKLYYNK